MSVARLHSLETKRKELSHFLSREGCSTEGQGGGLWTLTFLLRFDGRSGDEDSATAASLRSSRRARCARFCGVGIAGVVGCATNDHQVNKREGGVASRRLSDLAATTKTFGLPTAVPIGFRVPQPAKFLKFSVGCDRVDCSRAQLPEILDEMLRPGFESEKSRCRVRDAATMRSLFGTESEATAGQSVRFKGVGTVICLIDHTNAPGFFASGSPTVARGRHREQHPIKFLRLLENGGVSGDSRAPCVRLVRHQKASARKERATKQPATSN